MDFIKGEIVKIQWELNLVVIIKKAASKRF